MVVAKGIAPGESGKSRVTKQRIHDRYVQTRIISEKALEEEDWTTSGWMESDLKGIVVSKLLVLGNSVAGEDPDRAQHHQKEAGAGVREVGGRDAGDDQSLVVHLLQFFT